MAAGAAPGPELCPHCRRPFKRLRAHLPHCKAAPRPPPGSPAAPGTSPRTAPASASRPAPSPGPGSDRGSGARPTPASAPGAGSAPAASPQPSPATGGAPGPTPAPGPRPAPGTARGPRLAAPGSGSGSGRSGRGQPREAEAAAAGGSEGSAEPAVQDVARSLDLHPEEVEDVPGKLQEGVKVVIQQHRARVVREKEPGSGAGAAGSRGAPAEGTDPGPAPHPQRPKTAPKSKRKEARSQGAVGNGTGSSKGEKSRLKATEVLEEPPESRSSPWDTVRQEGRGRPAAGEEQVHLEAGVRHRAPLSALHPENLHLSLAEAFGAHGRGTSENELSSLRGPRGSAEQMEGASEPLLNLGRDPGLALLHAPKIQPTCSCQAPGRSARAGARGLEWFPDLYPDYEGLRIFPGQRFREDVRITVETPRGGFSQGQRGPLSERPLLEVRLGELHTWISTCTFSPRGLLGAVQKAWSSYCAKYIHVRQGGPAGVSMLLAGYCLLSYGWNYQHLKQHRWRKYH